MVWKALFHCIVFSALTSSAWAEALVVKSGDHDGFSRLVFRVPRESQWTLDSTALKATIELSSFDGGFDTSKVFDLIDQRYISEIESSSNSITLIFSCTCEAKAYQQSNGFIVIDVSELGTDSILTDFRIAPQNISHLSRQSLYFSGINNKTNMPRTLPSEQIVSNSNSGIPLIAADQDDGELTLNLLENSMNSTQESSNLSSFIEPYEALAKQIAMASTQGLLNASGSRISQTGTSNTRNVSISDNDLSQGEVESAPQAPKPNSNLRVTTSMDFPNDQLISGNSSASSRFQCPPNEEIELAFWGSTEPIAAQVARLRSALFSDLDRLDQSVALQLSKLYLHFGFGAEARRILEITDDLADSAPTLMELAEIMEFGYSMSPTHLPKFQECGGDVALWAILSQQTVPTTSAINTSAALRALGALPIHLRRFIAPELSRRLLDYGDKDGAAAALRSVSRSNEPLSGSGKLARAEIELSSGATNVAQSTLANIVTSNEQYSAEALIKFVDSHLATDTLIDESVATLVEAYAVEMRDDPLGAELRRTFVLALAKSGQFDAAFRELNHPSFQEGRLENEGELRHTLLDIMIDSAPDVVFLDNLFSDVAKNGPITDAATVRTAVKRLITLGFVSEADSLISNSNGLGNTASLKVIRAEIALHLGRPAEAQAVLFGVETPEANALRAAAKLQSGDFDGAREIFESLGEEDFSQVSALMAEDWQFLSEQGTDSYRSLAELSEHTIQSDYEIDGMLNRATTFISESQNARQIVNDLLSE